MTDEPEFPQETPAIKYIVGQVARIENVEACSTGYYKSLGKFISRLDKTDNELNLLNLQLKELKKLIDLGGVAQAIDNNTDQTCLVVKNGLAANIKEIDDRLNVILIKQRDYNTAIFKDISEISTRLDKSISDINERVIPPLWKIYLYTFVALGIGILIGRYAI